MAYLLVVVFMFLFTSEVQSIFTMNTRTCVKQENPSTYEIVQLDCTYKGPGVYVFEGPTTVKTLTIDRLTEEAHVNVRGITSLKEVRIMDGTKAFCKQVTAPPSVNVIVADELCKVETTSTTGYYTSTSMQDPSSTTELVKVKNSTSTLQVQSSTPHMETDEVSLLTWILSALAVITVLFLLVICLRKRRCRRRDEDVEMQFQTIPMQEVSINTLTHEKTA